MWDDIGKKIKILAKVIALIGIISSVIAGIILFVNGIKLNQNWGGGNILIFSGLGTIIGGSIISWIASWFMYGFGELIEKTNKIEKNTRKNDQKYNYIVINSINLRSNPSTSDSKIIKVLSEGSNLILLEKGENTIIDGLEAPWVKVQSEDDYIGWCFSGYIKEI